MEKLSKNFCWSTFYSLDKVTRSLNSWGRARRLGVSTHDSFKMSFRQEQLGEYTKLNARLALRQRADLLVANISTNEFIVFLRARAKVKENIVTAP